MMKRMIAALVLALVLLPACLPSGALFGQEKYDYLQSVADFIRENGLYSHSGDDPLARALVKLLDENPQALDLLLSHMLNSYDERSMFFPADYLAGQLQTTGYVGIGVTMTQETDEAGNQTVTVTALHEQGGARRAGVREGDRLLEVAGIDITQLEFSELPEILRFGGEAGTFVDMVVERDGVRLHFTLERTFLGEPEYAARPMDDGVWFMRWTQFRDDALLEDFHADLEAMKEAGATALILDLRGNGGGRLDMAFDIIDALIPEKDVHYLTLFWREGEEDITDRLTSPGGGLELENIVILCDAGTASASEIIQAALCETGHAISIGQRTYGKATAQYEIETPEQSLIILTAYRIRTALGTDYDKVGLMPDLMAESITVPRTDSGLRLREIPLSLGNCSDDAQALNEALTLLGLMGPAKTAYRFGEDTQAAVNNFRQQNGLPRAAGLDAEAARLLNEALAALPEQTTVFDRPLEQALLYIAGLLKTN